MIHPFMRAIAQLDFHLVSASDRRTNSEAAGNGHIAQTRFEPSHAIWARRFHAPRILKPSRQRSIEIGPCDGMADKRRPDIRPGVKDRADRPKRVQPWSLPGPLNGLISNYHLYV